MTVFLIVPVAWIYVIRGRFKAIAFVRYRRMTLRLMRESRALVQYANRYILKGEANRIYVTNRRLLRVSIFLTLGTFLTSLVAIAAYIGMMGKIVFKSMIIINGLRLNQLPFFATLKSLVAISHEVLRIQWLHDMVLYPFVQVIGFLLNFSIDFEPINVTCMGSTAPLKLLINLTVMGVVTVVVQSNVAIFKSVTLTSLLSRFQAMIFNVSYRTWSPHHFESEAPRKLKQRAQSFWSAYCGSTLSETARFFSSNVVWVAVSSTVVSYVHSIDLFQNTLQFIASKVTIVDFISYREVLHSWDKNCNAVEG